MSPLSITRIEPGDSDAELCARLMASSEPWLTLGRSYEASLSILRDPTREVYLARDREGMAGFLVLCLTGAFVGYIQAVAVEANRRGQGVGSRLLSFAEERIFADFPNVFMCVSSFNREAQRLYRRLGYQVVGELTDYIVTGHSEILLRKTIGPLNTWRRARDGAALASEVASKMREARLRPEFADLYPTLTPGQWEPAARVAEVVLARLLLLEISDVPPQDRVLNEEHFEFRGETSDEVSRSGASRVRDREG